VPAAASQAARLQELAVLQPLPKRQQPWQRFLILLAICRLFAPYNVIDVRNREAVFFDAPLPRIVKPFNTIWRKDQVQIEWARF